ncbi:3D domain-containing protein [Paenibacillus sp. P26]|nr:3D domain-containing protein [Paenibacillus sp. P26]
MQRVISTTLTAYTAGYESTGKKPDTPGYGITYSGNKVQEGRTIAVDPSVIPLGSTVYIDGIGIRQAEDIGSAIRGSRIDVYMNDLAEAKEFGVKKNVKVYVLSTDTA